MLDFSSIAKVPVSISAKIHEEFFTKKTIVQPQWKHADLEMVNNGNHAPQPSHVAASGEYTFYSHLLFLYNKRIIPCKPKPNTNVLSENMEP